MQHKPLDNEKRVNALSLATEGKILAWKNKVLTTINTAKIHHKKTNTLMFSYQDFSPENIHVYEELQQEIARIIPSEHERPTIEIIIKGKNRKNDSGQPDLGLIGGMGPLSDAEIIGQLIKRHQRENSSDNAYIRLLSSPPARDKEEGPFDLYLHKIRYVLKLRAFGMRPCKHYALLSNTAHRHAATFQKIIGFDVEHFANLVGHVAKQIASDPDKAEQVLVLGTTEAAECQLYPNALRQNQVQNSILPSKADQTTLQTYINHTKSDTLTAEMATAFINFIFCEIQKIARANELCQVVLSCTEIPLFLAKKIPEDKDGRCYNDILREKINIAGLQVKFIDTEEIMVDVLHQYQQTQAILTPVYWEKTFNESSKEVACSLLEKLTRHELIEALKMGKPQSVLQGPFLERLFNKLFSHQDKEKAQWITYIQLISKKLALEETPSLPNTENNLQQIQAEIAACRQKILDQHAFIRLNQYRVYKANEAIRDFHEATSTYSLLYAAAGPLGHDKIKDAVKADFYSAMHDNQLSNRGILATLVFAIFVAPIVWLFRKTYGSIESLDIASEESLKKIPSRVLGKLYNQDLGQKNTVPDVLASAPLQHHKPDLKITHGLRLFGPRENIRSIRPHLEVSTSLHQFLNRH